jgi:hypothetical protein
MRARGLSLAVASLAALVLLSGCAAPQSQTPGESESPSDSTPTPEATPTEVASEFEMPSDCTAMLPQARVSSFTAQGMVLLGGPGGLYGEDYLLDPTPEEQAGGITCIWGDELIPESTVTVSVAPLTPETRSAIIDDLVGQGLIETVDDGAVAYVRLGDEVSSPAILNVLRSDSWISVIEALGGEAFLEEARSIAAEVAVEVNAE